MDPALSNKVQVLVFACVIMLALLNTEKYYVLVGLWGVIGSIVCPLIVTVLPGSFFYYVLKEQEVEKKAWKVYGVLYSVMGLVLLPVFLTLSTKNLFSTTQTTIKNE